MKHRYHIAVVDDHSLFREGLVNLLSGNKMVKVLFESGNGSDTILKLDTFSPEIILLDIAMPGMDGVELMRTIKQRYPRIKIIVLSAHDEKEEITHYVSHGANAFLAKDCKISELLTVIEQVSKYGLFFKDDEHKHILKSNFPELRDLTDKELIVLKLFVKGATVNEIGEKLNLSQGTVSWYKNKLFNKTHTKSLEQLILYAQKNNLIN